jgi:hypothetical protein
MPYIDPWSGLTQGTQTLRGVVEAQQADKAYQMRMQQAQGDLAYKQGLRSLGSQLAGSGLSEDEKSMKLQQFMLEQGRLDDLHKLSGVEDMASKKQRREAGIYEGLSRIAETNPDVANRLAAQYGLSGLQFRAKPQRDYMAEIELRNSLAIERALALEALRNKNRDDDPNKGKYTPIGADVELGTLFTRPGDTSPSFLDTETGMYKTVADYYKERITKDQPSGAVEDLPAISGKELGKSPGRVVLPNRSFGSTPGDIGEGQTYEGFISSGSDKKAAQDTQKKQAAQYMFTRGYIGTMKTQQDMMMAMKDELERTDAKLLDLPLNKIEKYLTNATNRRNFDIVMKTFQNEAGKLASGSAQSIAALSPTVAKEWKDALPTDLPFSVAMATVDTVMQEGYGKAKSQYAEYQNTRNAVKTGELPKPDEGYVESPKTEPKKGIIDKTVDAAKNVGGKAANAALQVELSPLTKQITSTNMFKSQPEGGVVRKVDDSGKRRVGRKSGNTIIWEE